MRERIEAVRIQQGQELLERRWIDRQRPQSKTDKTKDILLAAKDRRIRELEAANHKLKAELKVAYGKLYDKIEK